MTAVRILRDLVGRGELLQRNIEKKEAAREFLSWLEDINDFVASIPDSYMQFEVRKSLKRDLVQRSLVSTGELPSRTSKMLANLRQVLPLVEEPGPSLPAPIQLGKPGSTVLTTFDEYRFVAEIRGGGSGVVYKAHDGKGDLVAIKVLRVGQTSEKTRRFKNEIAFCEQRWHPGIIRVLDHGVVMDAKGPQRFYVMPFYAGTYRDFMRSGPDVPRRLTALLQILDAVEAAHMRGCVHRDLKPENILANADWDTFVVSDFGIAHFAVDDLVTQVETKPGGRLANFLYAAPEQRVKGGKVDHRADIYALGLIIHETFTGTVPQGTGYVKVGSTHPDLIYLDDVVERMIQNDPQNRYASIAALKEAISIKGKLALSIQKVNGLSKKVVQDSDYADDPIIADPVRILEIDHDGKQLICRLNHHLPKAWVALWGTGSFPFSSMHHPSLVTFTGTYAKMATAIEQGREGLRMMETWIGATNTSYKEHVRMARLHASEEMRRRREADCEMEQKRQAFLRAISR